MLCAAGRAAFFGIASARQNPGLFTNLMTLKFAHEAGDILDGVPGIVFFFTYALLLSQW